MTALSKEDVNASLQDLRTKKAFLDLIEVATIAAAGADQTDATSLSAGINVVTAANDAKGVILPRAKKDRRVEVINTVSNKTLLVYPDTGSQINALTATTGAFSQVGGARAIYVCDADLHWYVAAANLTGTSTSSTTGELDTLHSVTAGTGAASKALVLDANGSVTIPGSGVVGLARGTLAATGTNQATAALVVKQISLVTAADGTVGVALPAAATTDGPYTIVNTVSTAPLPVYPVASGNDNINGFASNVAYILGPGEEATFTPTSATQWYAKASNNSKYDEIVTATNAITADESGKVFYLNSAIEFVSTLPAPAIGLKFTFIVSAAPSGASYTVVANGSANIIKGNQNSVAGDAGDFGTADDTITFVDGQSVAGDKVEVFCDGTNWFAYAISKVAAGVTFTQAS